MSKSTAAIRLCGAGLIVAIAGAVVGSDDLFVIGTVFAMVVLAYSIWRYQPSDDSS